MSAAKRQPLHWASFTTVAVILLPVALEAIWPVLRVEQFTPRQLIYSRNYIPFLLAPWTWPGEASAMTTRLIEAALLLRLPSSALFPCYGLWILIGLARTLCGFVLTRSVGWAYPRLFNHYALYETTGGLGPALVAYLGLTGARTWTDSLPKPCSRHAQEDRGSVVVFVACALLCWISGAPWTYVLSIACMLGVVSIRSLLSRVSRTHYSHPLSLEPERPPLATTRLRAVFQTACVCLLIIPQPALLHSLLTKPSRLPFMPYSPYPHTPLLEIVILSHPRPNDAAAIRASTPDSGMHKTHPAIPPPTSILFTTISSYLPFLASERESPARLSVFTHTAQHPAFKQAQGWLSPDSIPQHTNIPIEFYTDADAHPEAHPGQHLHLAEALRWAHGQGNSKGAGNSGRAHEVAEWVMVVEDDFALCGKWGWEGIVGVMKELEAGRMVVDGKETLARWGGFVGTGGSGLIIHRTLLPILSFILRAHASTDSALPPQLEPRPADLIIQDCLLGIDPLCPSPQHSSSLNSIPRLFDGYTPQPHGSAFQGQGGGLLVITSKLVMDHIGSSDSTMPGRSYEEGKWRCGWRHPFHGREEVDVIVV